MFRSFQWIFSTIIFTSLIDVWLWRAATEFLTEGIWKANVPQCVLYIVYYARTPRWYYAFSSAFFLLSEWYFGRSSNRRRISAQHLQNRNNAWNIVFLEKNDCINEWVKHLEGRRCGVCENVKMEEGRPTEVVSGRAPNTLWLNRNHCLSSCGVSVSYNTVIFISSLSLEHRREAGSWAGHG